MDLAAGKGYLEIVKWLHEHRTEGCNSSAMDSAASDGNLEVVKFLHQNRSEGCTSAAMENVVQNGHLHVVQWLYDNWSEDVSAEILDIAAVSGHLNVVKWLYKNGVRCDERRTSRSDPVAAVSRSPLPRARLGNDQNGPVEGASRLHPLDAEALPREDRYD